MSTGLQIAAVVVSYRCESDLPACLAALAVADGLTDVVVVDNASGDASVELARRAGGRVRVLELCENIGFAGGCNRGLEAVGEGFDAVAFLNPDVQVRPDCLARAADALAADPALGGLAPLLLRRDGVTVDSAGQTLNRLTLEVRDRGYGQPLASFDAARRQVLAACGALAVFRTAALAEGAWAEHFFCFWEDLELGWRLTNRGWHIELLPDAVAEHGRGAGARPGRAPLRWRRPVELEACVLSNRWMTMVRHLHPLDLAERLPLLLARDLTAVALGALRRPRLLGCLRRRWPLVVAEWRGRRAFPRRRLRELP